MPLQHGAEKNTKGWPTAFVRHKHTHGMCTSIHLCDIVYQPCVQLASAACRLRPPPARSTLTSRIGYSLIALSIGVFGMSILSKQMAEAESEQAKQVLSALGVFG